jgi:Ca2+-binding RTX toxin-like protein
MRWQHNRYRPTLELLEKRDLPTTAVLSGSYLYVTSTAHHQFITVSQHNGQLSVANTSITVGSSHVSSISTSKVTKVVVYAYGGSDVVNLRSSAANAVTKDSYIYVANGYNQVFGGNGSNYIVADGAGHNTLNGWTGNDYLAAGSSTDVLNGGGGFDYFYRPITPGVPFVNGEHVGDVKQGFSPSCQTDAALAEAVAQGYNFANNIHYLGNYQYDVSLLGGSVHEKVYFNGWYNDEDPMPTTSGEFWTILMYRARLEYLHINPTASFTEAQWDNLNRTSGNALYSVAASIYTFTGRSATYLSMNSVTPQTLKTDLAKGDYVVVSSVPGGGATPDGIVRDHAYAVLSVYYQGGMWKVQLYNPWGFDSVNGKTIESLSGSPPKNLGFITVSWSQFVNTVNFMSLTVAQPKH